MVKNTFFCKIAGNIYEVEYVYDYTPKMIGEYIISKNQIKNWNEVIKIAYTDKDFERISRLYPDNMGENYIEYTCIMDQVGARLPSQNMLLMHGAAIEYEGKGYIFTAPSGTGKTTHISLWKKYLCDKVKVINGDKPELSFEDAGIYVHGAPWCGKEGWQMNAKTPLAGVCLLKRAKKGQNSIQKINPGKYIEFFMNQFYIGNNAENILKVVDLFHKMTRQVSFYLLECDISKDALKCSYEMMVGKTLLV